MPQGHLAPIQGHVPDMVELTATDRTMLQGSRAAIGSSIYLQPYQTRMDGQMAQSNGTQTAIWVVSFQPFRDHPMKGCLRAHRSLMG